MVAPIHESPLIARTCFAIGYPRGFLTNRMPANFFESRNIHGVSLCAISNHWSGAFSHSSLGAHCYEIRSARAMSFHAAASGWDNRTVLVAVFFRACLEMNLDCRLEVSRREPAQYLWREPRCSV